MSTVERERRLLIAEGIGRVPFMLTWQTGRGMIEIRYFSAYLAALNKLEALNQLGLIARLYVEIEIEPAGRLGIDDFPPCEDVGHKERRHGSRRLGDSPGRVYGRRERA